MRHCRYLISYAHVRTAVVVEVDESPDDLFRMLPGAELPPAINTFFLDNTVDTLGDGVVGRLVVLRHGDGDSMGPEHVDILITAVLDTAVRVVNQLFQAVASPHRHGLSECLPQCLHGGGGLERVSQHPAYDFVGISVCDKVQIAVSISRGEVGDIRHPQLVGGCQDKPADEVLPLVVTVVGVGRMTGLRGRKHQMMTAQKDVKTIPSHDIVPSVHVFEHQPQLKGTDAKVFLPDIPDILNKLTLTHDFLLHVDLHLVEGLTAMAK